MKSGLIDLAETAVPGLRDAIAYAEVGTPLTIEHFTSHAQGCFYGLPLTPERFQANLATPQHPSRTSSSPDKTQECPGS